MQLKEIDKTRYQKHLRVVFVAIAISLMIIAVSSSTLFIQLFSTPDASHFLHNLAGVIFAAVIVVIVLNKLRPHPYMLEVVYVWDLKQALNQINRKLPKVEAAVEKNNKDAMIVLNFMYHGSKQLFELDDNTITINSLMSNIRILDQRIEDAGLSISTDQYDASLLDKFN